ncbi:L-type lectin-domain containing receptor kinase S.7-like [Phragmites australis]|uniref:L-type lectin-domain containing receptor kinase S.7-like n=1 Tax=Phragmites australis TaxID=29695 RepID=UPI002D7771F7|nr:L-type lectin-domain containing receptor kinase S.7-like [Phragmites australis]XP_062223340.1 L-type lectin-domain containing receptor kinase S.7-like [Phragmites australis]XP_062223341.1 L-type lectin-domain containing receptor kinase S.7-like [Phragmites australis]
MPPLRSSVPFFFFLLLAVSLPRAAALAKHRPTASITTPPSSYVRISWASNLTLLGSASLLPGAAAVALTTPSRDGIGAGRALFSEPIRLLLPSAAPASFSTRFTFRITPAPTYGDGLAFLLTSSRTFLGASNGFLGLFPSSSASDEGEADLRGVSTVAIELDTHRDVALRDPNGNHVALDAGSIFSVASASPGVDLKAGVPITAWVEYLAPRRRLSVWLSYSSFRRPEKPALSADVDLSGLLRTYMYAGFSASNGNGAALHVIERWTFRTFGFANSSQASPPSEPPVPPNKPLPFTGNHHSRRHLFYKVLGGVLGGVVLLVLVIVGSVVWLSRPIRHTSKEPVVPSEDKPYGTMSMEVVRAATKNFDSGNVIGVGGSGATVYEGVLLSGSRVAVKRFQAIWPCTKAFVSELAAMLNCPHHPNLVRLAGWCCSKDELVLVYEFMPNGNLDSALHTPGGATLPWEARFRAVLGVASALEYLHDECDRRILHRDVKSSNVLLDGEFNARLGDFGLARLVSHGGLPLTTQPAGTLGYLAPEYVHSGVATERSDVYSFGVLALEVATGRRPTERGVSVIDWVWVLWGRRRLVDAADQRLQGRFVGEEMRRVLLVGLSCVHPDCRKRPGMRRVVRMLDGTAPLTLVPDKKPPVMLQTQVNQASSMNSADTVNTAFYSCR